MAITLCYTDLLDSGGGDGRVCFIDTEGTFRPDRILEISERFGVDGAAVLENIIHARAYTHEHQYDLLIKAAAKMVR